MRVRREIMKRMIVRNNKSHKLSNSNKLMDQMMQPSQLKIKKSKVSLTNSVKGSKLNQRS
jgi:hypothetical protein